MKRIVVEQSGLTVAEPLEVALTGWQRFRGLMLRRALAPQGGLLIPECRSVHTCLMRFAIDIVYLTAELEVVKVAAGLRPWRLSWCLRANSVLELNAGRAAAVGLRPGDRLAIHRAEGE